MEKIQKLEYVDFCKSKVILPSESLKKEIIDKVRNINLTSRLIKRLERIEDINETYLITDYIRTTRTLFLLLTFIDKKRYTIIIDNTNPMEKEYYLTNLRFNSKLYNGFGTLLYGELVYEENKKWLYYLTDIYNHQGKRTIFMSMRQKIDLITDLLKYDYMYDDYLNPFYIQIKPFYLLNHLEAMEEDRSLLFYPDNSNLPVLSLDLKMEVNEEEKKEDKLYTVIKGEYPDIYKVYDQDTFIDILCVKKLSYSLKLRELFENCTTKQLECYYQNKRWHCKL